MARGIVRRMDDLGRIVIPSEFRKVLGLKEYTPIELSLLDDQTLVLRKHRDSCAICGDESGYRVKDRVICEECLELALRARGE